MTSLTIAALGCSGHVTQIFMDSFLKRGITVRILARDPQAIQLRFPNAIPIQGSMMNPQDVARVMDGVDAAFLVTPMSFRNETSLEIDAAKSVIAGAQASKLKHLIYTSVLGADQLRGVGILDSKHDIEHLIAQSGLPWTALRCGSYMEDVFDSRLPLLNKGKFLFPVTKDRRFTYTSQQDIPRFVVEELLSKNQILNRAFNFVSPGTYSIRDVEKALTNASGFDIHALSKFPTYYLYMALLPYFNFTGHKFSSILPLIRYFDRCGFIDSGTNVRELFPQFKTTALEEHLAKLWPK